MEGAFTFALLFLTFFVSHASGAVELELTPGTDQVKTSGGNIVINCAINDESGEVQANLKWYNPNGEEIKKDSRTKIRISVNSAKLYLQKLTAEDAGSYTCNTTVNGKSLEKIINLRIFKKHSFEQCETHQQPIIHTNAKISCTASGDPVPVVSWRHKGKAIKTGGRYDVKPDGLIIQNITEADNGVYEIESEITIRSDFIVADITVKVTIPPRITQPPVMSDPIKGTDFTMTCKAVGKPKPTYVWKKNNLTINDDRFIIDDEGGSLEISSVQESDSGTYNCIAVNVGGKASAKASVTVLIPPTIDPIENKQVEEGKRTTLTCVGKGVPLPSLTWQKGTDAPYATGSQSDSRIVVSEKKDKETKLSLTISSLKAEDAANYTCIATNTASTKSKKVQLRISYRPQIVNTPVVAYNWMNNKRNISCSAKGLPKPFISWTTKKGKIESSDDTYRIFQTEGYELFTSYLQVQVSRSNAETVFTDYQCMAINKLGQRDINITLKQAVVPRPPQKVTHLDLSPTTITLAISVPTDNGGIEVDQYQIHYGIGGVHNKTDKFVDSKDKSEFAKVVLDRLEPESKYQIKVFAGNAVGLSTKSYDLSVTTLSVRRPYDVFINSDKLASSSSHYTVTWNEPRTGGASITSYSVQYRTVHIKKDVEPWEVDADGKNGKFMALTVKDKTSAALHDLQPDTYYEIQVVANNIIGPSEPRPVIILTKPKSPDSYEEPEYPEEDVIEKEDDPLAVVTVPQQKENSNKDTNKGDQSVLINKSLTDQPLDFTVAGQSLESTIATINGRTSSSSTTKERITTNKNVDNIDTIKSSSVPSIYQKVDHSMMPQAATSAGISEGGIVGVIIALLIIILVVIDLGCYVKLDKGVTKFLLENVCKRTAASKDKSTDVEAGASQETNLLAEKEKKDGEANGEENKEPASDENVTDEKNEDKDELMKDHTDEIEPDQKKDGDIIGQDPVKA